MAVVEKQLSDTIMRQLPRDKWRKAMFKTPLVIWRLGLRYALPPSFACITTRGRVSGLPRHTMVEHSRIDGAYYVVSGWQDQAHWVKNLLADPHITIQPVHGKAVSGTARRVLDDPTLQIVAETMQHSPMWQPWLESLDIQTDDIGDLIAKKDRTYIFEIVPTDEPGLPALEADLRPVTLLVGGLVAFLIGVRLIKR